MTQLLLLFILAVTLTFNWMPTETVFPTSGCGLVAGPETTWVWDSNINYLFRISFPTWLLQTVTLIVLLNAYKLATSFSFQFLSYLCLAPSVTFSALFFSRHTWNLGFSQPQISCHTSSVEEACWLCSTSKPTCTKQQCNNKVHVQVCTKQRHKQACIK